MSKFSYLIVGIIIICFGILFCIFQSAYGQPSSIISNSAERLKSSISEFKMIGSTAVSSNIMEFSDGRYRIFTTGNDSIFVIKVE